MAVETCLHRDLPSTANAGIERVVSENTCEVMASESSPLREKSFQASQK